MQFNRFQVRSSMIAVAAMLAPGVAAAQTAPPEPAQTAPAAKPADRSNEVVVTGRRSDVQSSPDRLSFNIANDLQAQNGTVADALRAVPGVEVDLEGNVSQIGRAHV